LRQGGFGPFWAEKQGSAGFQGPFSFLVYSREKSDYNLPEGETSMQNELWEVLKNDPMMLREFVDIHKNMTLWQRFSYGISLGWWRFKMKFGLTR
jgi:hypothetical protein